MVTARPAATGAANPQMPAPSTNDPSTGAHAPVQLALPLPRNTPEQEEQLGSMNAEIL